MADHEDHNYYTRSNRESQIPDYDVSRVDPSDNSLLPSFAYRRESRGYSPKRPSVSTSFDQNNSNARSSRALGGYHSSNFETSPDPHEFYRQYRESFQRRPESVYGQFDGRVHPSDTHDSMASGRQQRHSPMASRVNGYNTTPVSARWNRSLDNRMTPSPTIEKSGSRPNTSSSRARNDIQALVHKFNSVRDESPPAPIRPSSTTKYATQSPPSMNPSTPKSFRSRASLDTRTNTLALGKRPVRESGTGRIGGGSSAQVSARERRPSQVSSIALASQSMTNLSPSAITAPRQPLFGEILLESLSLTDTGYGIPGGRRRGSEGNLHTSSTIFRHDKASSSSTGVEPSSPSAWYMGSIPSLDGLNLTQPLPPKKKGMHRKSRSDLGIVPVTLASYSTGLGKPLNILSPPQELPTPSSRTSNRPPSHSRIPISSRRTSVTSDSGNSSSGYRTPTKSGTSIPIPKNSRRSSEYNSSRMSTRRRSPRYRNPSPPQLSPNVSAYVAESSTALKSPPLRSSRPRMSVANASTAASRARQSYAYSDTEQSRPPSKIPNLPPNANMEQRRQMIRRDFTKSWHEKEERHKRQSLYMQNLNDASIPDMPSPGRAIMAQAPEPPQSSPDNDETFATPTEKRSPQPEITVDTTENDGILIQEFDHGDSPTLGTADFPTLTRRDLDSSPESALIAREDTLDTFPEQRSQGSGATHQIEEDISTNELETPRLGVASPRSEFDDGESIAIMLGDSPVLERSFLPSLGSLRTVIPRTPTPISESEKGNNTPQPTNLTPNEASSTMTHKDNDILWSPTAHLTDSASQNRESGNSIESLLETYQESEPRRLFSQSPGLARAGGWDNSKVTRMYLQSRSRKTPEPTDIPPQPNFQTEEVGDFLLPGALQTTPTQTIPRSQSSHRDTSGEEDVFTEAITQQGLAVPPGRLDHRASLSHRDDFVDISPSMLDWMHDHQPSVSPHRERSESRAGLENGFSPDIPGGGLGIIDMNLNMAQDLPSELPTDSNFISELHSAPQRRKNSTTDPIPINELHGSSSKRSEMPATANTTPRKPVPANSHKSLQTIIADTKPLSEVASTNIKKTSSFSIGGAASDKPPSLSSESIHKTNGSPVDLPQDEESKRLRRRLNIIKELIDTESTYGQDMSVVVDIYKGTCNMVLNSAQDERALFINSPEIVAFSTVFLDALKSAAKSIYVLPKSKRWRSKRDSSATQESSAEDQNSLYGLDLSDEERDRLTAIGSAFCDHLVQMERCYTEFLKNSEAANAKLKMLQEDDKVKVWLDECCAYAKDLTTAWSLDSLLVKPLQRITKYPLLLRELCDVTPENHPDFVKLDTAAREISGVSKRINEAKRRMEMVEKVTQDERYKRKDEGRLNLQKAFGRRSDKYKASVSMQEQFQDRDYNQISDKFGTHFFKLQIVMRDVEMYIDDVQGWVVKFNGVTAAMEDYFNVGSTTYPEIESKWRRFRSNMKEMQNTALADHVAAVRKFVIDPMATLLKLHDGPQRLMERRKKRIPDFVKFKTLKDRGERLDKKTTESAELFLAVNDTLKDELPKLFEMTSRLVEACLNNFVQLQLQWQSVWKRKMIQAIELAEVPRSFIEIVSDFSGDFRYTEAHVLSLGVCNGSVLADASSFLLPLSQSSTQIGDGSRRPSTTTTLATDTSGRARAASHVASTPIDPTRMRGYSGPAGSIGPSPMLPSPDLGRPIESFGLGSHLTVNSTRPAQGLRVRASSTTSSRSPITPDTSSFRNLQQITQTPSYGRPSTSTGQSYESIPTYTNDMNRLRSDVDTRYQSRDVASQQIQTPLLTQPTPNYRTSGIFNSAMPMSDSPHASSPANDIQGSQGFNVLFLAASVYEFNIDRARREAGYPYLTYVAGEVRSYINVSKLKLILYRFSMSSLKRASSGLLRTKMMSRTRLVGSGTSISRNWLHNGIQIQVKSLTTTYSDIHYPFVWINKGFTTPANSLVFPHIFPGYYFLKE